MKQNQIIALVSGKKTRIQKFMTNVHHNWQKDRMSGINRTFAPLEDGGETFPPESRSVQLRVGDLLKEVSAELSDFYQVVASQETGNTVANADILVDGSPILQNVPVTVLLFLEKQLSDIRTFASGIPTLPADKEWRFDDAKNCWVTQAEQTIKTQKKQEVIVSYEATKEHPAQTTLVQIDKTIGKWSTIHSSGAMPEKERTAIVARIEMLQDAVKVAREEANSIEASMRSDIGCAIMDYIFTSK